MSLFWNHILANLANLSMCLSLIYWYFQSMYLGTKGEFFSDLYIFGALHHALRQSFFLLLYVPTLILQFILEWPRAHLPHQWNDHVCTCPISTDHLSWHRQASKWEQWLHTSAAVTSYLWSIHTQHLIAPLNWYIRHGYRRPPLRGDTPCWGRQSPEALIIDIRRRFCWCGCIDHLSCCCRCISFKNCLGGQSIFSFIASLYI
jgi:hypothetical protein